MQRMSEASPGAGTDTEALRPVTKGGQRREHQENQVQILLLGFPIPKTE